MKIALCLLTKNELPGCQHDVPLVNREWFDEIFAVDGHSSDGTIEFLESCGFPVYLQPRKSLNAATTYAFEKCTADALVFFHPKGSIDPVYLKEFRSYFEQGFDHVVASRMIRGARNEEDGQFLKPRKWFGLTLGFTAAMLFRRTGPVIWDVLHGFRGMTKQSFEKLGVAETGVTIDLEMVVRSYKQNLRQMELAVTEGGRLGGSTHFKALPTGWELLKYLARELVTKR